MARASSAGGTGRASSFAARAAVCLSLLVLAGCGYVGDPQPPALKIPHPVAGLDVKQRADRILIEFVPPKRTLEDLPVDGIGGIDLRGGPAQGDTFNWDSWAEGARKIEAKSVDAELVKAETGIDGWTGSEVIFAVRVANSNGRFSSWSTPFVLAVVPPLAPPADLRAAPAPGGVRLQWKAGGRPGQQFRIFRRAEKEEASSVAAEVAASEWLDTTAAAGARYEYSVQAVMKAGNGEAVSDPSAVVSVLVKDEFPPARPAGLTAVASQASIELTWDRNTEADLRSYKVYRSEGDGQPELLADSVDAPGYSDRTVQPGRRYIYSVSAVDFAGNESARSEPAEAETR